MVKFILPVIDSDADLFKHDQETFDWYFSRLETIGSIHFGTDSEPSQPVGTIVDRLNNFRHSR